MKIKLIVSFHVFIWGIFNCYISFGQYNLVNNSGFESGSSACFLNQNVDNWSIAPHNNDEGAGDLPVWADPNSNACNGDEMYYYQTGCSCIHGTNSGLGMTTGSFPPIYPMTKFVVISQYGIGGYNIWHHWKPAYDIVDDEYRKNRHNAIITQLIHPLEEGKSYYIKMKYVAYTWQTLDAASGRNHLRVLFTKNNSDWSENNNNNQIFEAIDANIVTLATGFQNCTWRQYERMFTVPTGSGYSQLNNLVFYVEEGSFGIDDIEIYEKCNDNLFIENKTYDGYFYNPSIQGQNYFFQANNTLKAGYDINSPPYGAGNVIVQSGADITYTAGQEIELLPGFEAEYGSEFEAKISPCGSFLKFNDAIKAEFITTKNLFVNDTITFFNTSQNYNQPISYYWDFNNGIISREQNPVIVFNDTGTYNVSFKIVDAENKTDNITKRITISNLPDINGILTKNPACGGAPVESDTLVLMTDGVVLPDSICTPAVTNMYGEFHFDSLQIASLNDTLLYTIATKSGFTIDDTAKTIQQWISESPLILVLAADSLCLTDSSNLKVNSTNTSDNQNQQNPNIFIHIIPNPNNGNMQVIYKIPETETGILEIYDLVSKKLLSYPLYGGKNTFSISATELDNGIYFYRATAGNKLIAKDKLVVIK